MIHLDAVGQIANAIKQALASKIPCEYLDVRRIATAGDVVYLIEIVKPTSDDEAPMIEAMALMILRDHAILRDLEFAIRVRAEK